MAQAVWTHSLGERADSFYYCSQGANMGGAAAGCLTLLAIIVAIVATLLHLWPYVGIGAGLYLVGRLALQGTGLTTLTTNQAQPSVLAPNNKAEASGLNAVVNQVNIFTKPAKAAIAHPKRVAAKIIWDEQEIALGLSLRRNYPATLEHYITQLKRRIELTPDNQARKTRSDFLAGQFATLNLSYLLLNDEISLVTEQETYERAVREQEALRYEELACLELEMQQVEREMRSGADFRAQQRLVKLRAEHCMRKVELQLGNLFDTQERLLAQKTPPTALMYRYLKDEVREKIKELQYTAGEEVARLKAAGIGPAVIQPIADNYSARRQELRSLLVQLNGD